MRTGSNVDSDRRRSRAGGPELVDDDRGQDEDGDGVEHQRHEVQVGPQLGIDSGESQERRLGDDGGG